MRRQRPRGTTTKEAVVNAALAVIDTVGIERVTIRSVAKLAGAPPMSLYTHFTNKQELLDLANYEVTRRMYAIDADIAQTWQDDLMALCRQVRSVFVEHPRWIPLISRPVVPEPVPRRELVLKRMVEGGMTPEQAMEALLGVMLTTVGLVLIEVGLREPNGRDGVIERYARLRDWAETSADEHSSVTRAAVSKLRRLDVEENFELSLRSLIAGLDVGRRPNGAI